MKPNMILKISVDFAMTVLLLLLMARQLTGNTAHEWLGAAMFLLWAVHHILNARWHSHLLKGKYTPVRAAQTVVNLLLLLAMIGTMVSAVILSREVFAFLPISGGIAPARPMHIFCSFWSFVLMALHLGLHWNMILGLVRKASGTALKGPAKIILRTAGAAAAVYGIYAFLKNRIFSYLFLISSFVFFDFERPLPLFFLEYAAMMGLFVFLSYYGTKGLQRLGRNRKADGKR